MSENENVWIAQLVEAVRQSLAHRLDQIAQDDILAPILSEINDVLDSTLESDPGAIKGLVTWLVPEFGEQLPTPEDINDAIAVGEVTVERLIETVAQALADLKVPDAPAEVVSQPFSGSVQTAVGEAIAQATGSNSYAIAIETLVVSYDEPPRATRKRDIPDMLLATNPVDRIVGFQEHIDRFLDLLKEPASHLILIDVDSGKGKSFLIYRLMHICEELDHIFAFVDLKAGFVETIQGVIDTISGQTGLGQEGGTLEGINASLLSRQNTNSDKKCVLFIDTINDAPGKDLTSWLVNNLAQPIKHQHVCNFIIVMAGNQYMPRPSKRDNWDERFVTRYLALPDWDHEDITRYAEILGLAFNDEDIDRFYWSSGEGDPLTCALIMKNYRAKPLAEPAVAA